MPHPIRSESDDSTIYIYDPIAKDSYWGEDVVSAKAIILALDSIANAPKITIRINSPGGDVFEGDAIYNAIRRKAMTSRIHVAIDGVAASAAAFVAMAGDEIEIAENAFLMIHESWTYAMGNKRDIGKSVELLAKVDETIAKMMATRSGQKLEDVTAWLEAETWFTADEAVEKKFADKKGQSMKAAVSDATARVASMWAKTPQPMQAAIAAHAAAKKATLAKSPTPRLAALNSRLKRVAK